MTRAATWLLLAGVLLFVGVLASQGVAAVFLTLALAKWGLLLVSLFHLLPAARYGRGAGFVGGGVAGALGRRDRQ